MCRILAIHILCFTFSVGARTELVLVVHLARWFGVHQCHSMSNVCRFPLRFSDKGRSETYSEPSQKECTAQWPNACGKGVAFLCGQRFDQLAARFSRGTFDSRAFSQLHGDFGMAFWNLCLIFWHLYFDFF